MGYSNIYKIKCNDQVYIGSTDNLKQRIDYHTYNCYNEKCKHYNIKLYRYIRENDIEFTENCFIVVSELLNVVGDELRKIEQGYIDYYNSIKNGLNDRRAYQTKEERLTQVKEWRKKRVKCDICGKEMNQSSLTRHKKSKH
jgi:hypothetical protein